MKTPTHEEAEADGPVSKLTAPTPSPGEAHYERAVRHEDNLERVAKSLNAARFEETLHIWRESENSVQAFEAFAYWDTTTPLPQDLANFLKNSSQDFVQSISPFMHFAGKNWNAAAGAAAFLDAFGFLGPQVKGASPFLQLRKASLDYKAASSYAENCIAHPRMKAEEIVKLMADGAGVATATMWKHVRGGMKTMGIKWSKKRPRTEVPAPALGGGKTE